MRIKAFTPLVMSHVKNYTLFDCNVIIDGNNFFYHFYEHSKLQHTLGAESDKYAEFLRKSLERFKKANVTCYFVFMGGHLCIEKCLHKTFHNLEEKSFKLPLYAKEIVLEVLDEMNFKYVFCEYSAKDTCISLAKSFACPVISFDVEYAISGVDYVPHTYNKLGKHEMKLVNNKIECKIFKFDDFLTHYNLTLDKFELFVLLTDESIFPEDVFVNFFKSLGAPRQHMQRNIYLLKRLVQNKKYNIDKILSYVPSNEQQKIQDSLCIVREKIYRNVESISALYYTNENKVIITESDPLWFEKGVILGYIALSYIDLYRTKIVVGSGIIEDCSQDNALLLSFEVIKYAYDLLTNFKGGEITMKIVSENVNITDSISKPNYNCQTCVFENGWENIKTLNLFHHFIYEKLRGFNFNSLGKAPEDTKLLLIALTYFSKVTDNIETKDKIASILMSHVILNECKATSVPEHIAKPKSEDCKLAKKILKKYFCCGDKVANMYSLYPLVQFQHCLKELNNLNKLCGKPFKPTIYNRTFNGTFVYNLSDCLNNENTNINNLLDPCMSVLKYFNNLNRIYNDLLSSC